MHKMYIKQIIEKSNKESMNELEHLFIKSIDHIKECDYELYCEIERKLYEALYGKKIIESKAEEIIMNMKPYGCKYSLEDSKKIQMKYGMTSIDAIEYWLVINSAYNDYHNLFDENEEMYAKFTKEFIEDKDANEHKVYTYFTKIPKKD